MSLKTVEDVSADLCLSELFRRGSVCSRCMFKTKAWGIKSNDIQRLFWYSRYKCLLKDGFGWPNHLSEFFSSEMILYNVHWFFVRVKQFPPIKTLVTY